MRDKEDIRPRPDILRLPETLGAESLSLNVEFAKIAATSRRSSWDAMWEASMYRACTVAMVSNGLVPSETDMTCHREYESVRYAADQNQKEKGKHKERRRCLRWR